ncbi:MAG: metal-dependent hydrolase [Deltaproteobacteria bacterium]|nr:metal-dependent hydrolase [Deltaproteobacteria bacterium]
MDPLTQGLLGGVAAQAVLRKRVTPAATVAGILGGMAPDLDVLIRSQANPLLMYEYHRHFTHSLAFIPVGGALVGFLLWLLLRRKPPLGLMLIAAVAGFATHGLLDACTSYGTMLYWPFSRERVAWDNVFIIDPFYTFALLVGLVVSWRRRLGNAAIAALLLSTAYLGLGIVQHHRAADFQAELARSRGHAVERSRVIPSLGPHLLWRSIYLSDGRLYVDALRVPYAGAKQYWRGGSLPHYSSEALLQNLPPDSTLAGDLRTFAWFTQGYVAELGGAPLELGDLRFSTLPQSLQPLWGIRVDPRAPERHVQRLRFPWRSEDRFEAVWELLRGRTPGARDLPAAVGISPH